MKNSYCSNNKIIAKIDDELKKESVKEYYKNYNIIKNIIVSDCENVLKPLKSIIVRSSVENDGDLLGYIYQKTESIKNKKNKGQYFTPDKIVNHILEKIITPSVDYENIKILDPACGSGQFLIKAFSLLLNIYLKNGYDAQTASRRILKNNLFGYDIDSTALLIAEYNLKNVAFIYDVELNLKNHNFLLRDDFAFDNSNPFDVSFNYIVGNPPWGSNLTAQEKKYFRKNYFSAKSGINTFTLFIEKAIEELSENGKVGFLIPEAYLNIKAHSNSRKNVLENCLINEISLWGDQFEKVYAPAISLSLTMNQNYKKHHENIVDICDEKNREENTRTLIPQHHYYNTYQNIFNVNYSQKAVNIINKIENQNCFYLKDNAKFFLGIVTGNNPKFISKEKNEDTPDPIIIGKDVKPYSINFSGNYFKYDSKVLQQTAPKELYEKKDKIIYKFIGKKLSFAIERDGYYTLNNVNGFITDDRLIDKNALVGILNSQVLQYYYEKNFFTLKVLRNNLESLPLIDLNKDSEKKISELSKMAMNTDLLCDRKKYTDNIDDILLYEYNLKDKEGYRIWEENATEKDQIILPGL